MRRYMQCDKEMLFFNFACLSFVGMFIAAWTYYVGFIAAASILAVLFVPAFVFFIIAGIITEHSEDK